MTRKKIFFSISLTLMCACVCVCVCVYIYDGNSLNLWQSFHDIFKSNKYAVYTLNLYSAICQFVIVWSLSRVQLFVTPGTVARQAPLSVGFSRQR